MNNLKLFEFKKVRPAWHEAEHLGRGGGGSAHEHEDYIKPNRLKHG